MLGIGINNKKFMKEQYDIRVQHKKVIQELQEKFKPKIVIKATAACKEEAG